MPRLHSFDNAYVVMGGGNNGAVITSGLESVVELCAHTQLGQRPRPLDLNQVMQEEVLEEVVVGVDGASHNYYHWLVNALARSRLCAEFTPGATIVLPDFRLEGALPGGVKPAVLNSSMQAFLNGQAYRLLSPGVYRARRLHALWTRPTAPTDVSALPRLYEIFDSVAQRLAPAAGPPSRRLYFSRSGVHERRMPEADQVTFSRLLAKHGFETLVLEDLSFEEQVIAAAQAQIIVGPHGAGLTNLVFSPRQCIVIELTSKLQSEESFRPWFYQLSSSRGQRYGAIYVAHADWLSNLGSALARCVR